MCSKRFITSCRLHHGTRPYKGRTPVNDSVSIPECCAAYELVTELVTMNRALLSLLLHVSYLEEAIPEHGD